MSENAFSMRVGAFRTARMAAFAVALLTASASSHGQEFREGACTPLDVTTYKDRVILRCANELRDGMQTVRSFTVMATDGEFANRFLIQANTALTAGRPLRIQYQSQSWSKPPERGCDNTECRLAHSIGIF